MVIPGGMYCNQDCEFFEGNVIFIQGITLKKHEYTDKSTCTALVYAVTCNFHFYLHTNFRVHEQHVWFMNRVKGLIKGMAIPSPNFACP